MVVTLILLIYFTRFFSCAYTDMYYDYYARKKINKSQNGDFCPLKKKQQKNDGFHEI